MRKLLVASQKGGVGKTTTSINLAAAAALSQTRVLLLDADPLSSVSAALDLENHPGRRLLRECGVDLPGVLVCDVLPGLDVLSPYESGSCSDAELTDLLHLFDSPPFQASYGCLIVDSPPFLGTNPGQLVGACDGLIVVMRAEPLAHRTLPALLELVQRVRGQHAMKTHGVLLTLAGGEEEGGDCEKELRGRLGGRVLAQTIPFDAEVNHALEQHRIATEAAPDSPAVARYHWLAEVLKLAADPFPLKKAPGAAPFVAAASAARQLVGALAISEPSGQSLAEEIPPADLDLPSFADLSTVGTPSLTLPAFRPSPAALARLQVKPMGAEAVETSAATPPQRAAIPVKTPPPWWWSAGLAVVIGVSLRFIQLPDYVLPIVVGLAVAAAVVLALRLSGSTPEVEKEAVLSVKPLTRRVKRLDSPEGRKAAAQRLTTPTRKPPTGSYRRPKRI